MIQHKATTKPTKIAVIGAGNMGQAIIKGLLNNNYAKNSLWLSAPTLTKLEILATTLGITVTTNNIAAINQAAVVILAVKPQILSQVAQQLAPSLAAQKPIVISLAAGITLTTLTAWLGAELPLIRAMPNIAAIIGNAITALYASPTATAYQQSIATALFQAIGITLWLDQEAQLDAVTALSGSGPAYFCLLTEAMTAAGVELGLSLELSQLLANHTAAGTGQLLSTFKSAPELRAQVTSPNGTTAAALQVLEQGAMPTLIKQAIIAAYKRAQELRKLT